MKFNKTERKKFIAFRTEFIYWAGHKARLPKSSLEEFGEQVNKPVYIYENDLYTLCFCHTGLIMLHVVDFETEEDEIFQAYEKIWELEDEVEEYKKTGDEDGMKRVATKAKALMREREEHLPDIDNEIARWETCLRYVNSLYFVLICLRGKLPPPANRSTPPLGFLDTSRFIIREGKIEMYSFEMIPTKKRVFEEHRSSNTDHWGVVPKATFDEINEIYSIVMSRPRLAERLSQILKASNEYENHNFSYALLLAWLIIESVLMEKWETYLQKNANTPTGKKRITTERNKILIGRDYPIAVVLNFLELSNELTLDQYSDLDSIRRIRNKIIHGDKNSSCTEKDCKRAIGLSLKLSTEGTPLDFEWHLDLFFVPSIM